MKKILITTMLLILFQIFGYAYTISYYGKMLDSSQRRINSGVDIIFSIYTSENGGTALWTETHNSVNVDNGLFLVELGSVNAINLKFDEQYYLGINVNGAGELFPRSKLYANGYVFRSKYSDTAQYLENNAIAEGNVTVNDTLIIGGNVIITDDGKIGVGTARPAEKIDVSGNIKASGSVTAAVFIGDGS